VKYGMTIPQVTEVYGAETTDDKFRLRDKLAGGGREIRTLGPPWERTRF